VLPCTPGQVHNRAVFEGQTGIMACPQCGSSTQVHSVQEMADLARMRLSQTQQGLQAGPPQSGLRGWEAEPQPIRQDDSPRYYGGEGIGSIGGESIAAIGDDIAGAVLGGAAKFIGRAIGRRVQRSYTQRVQPAMAAQQEAMLRNQIAIAERHPDLRGCMNDQVIFLAGGNRVLPFPNLMTLTIDQADAMVATLRSG
jgi:hypothetical protein